MRYLLTFLITLLAMTFHAQVAITIPAEYEKNDNLLLVWPYSSAIDSVICEVTEIAKQVVDVDILYNPDSNQFDTTQIRSFLTNMGIDNENVNFIPSYTNTYWLRQFSPVTGYGVFTDNLVQYLGNPGFSGYNRPLDDSVPTQLASYWDMDGVNYGLEFENTNIQYDGLRNLFVGDRILEQNLPMDENEVRFSLNAYFSSGEVVFMPSLYQSGGGNWHSIDTYMKLLDFETILVSKIPDTLPDYNILEDIATELESTINYFGVGYEVIRILAPPNDDGKYPVTPEEEMVCEQSLQIVKDTIDQMPDEDAKKTVNLFYKLGLSYQEIADKQNITPEAARQRMSRFRGVLKKRLLEQSLEEKQ